MKRVFCVLVVCVLLLGLCMSFAGCEKNDFPEDLKEYLSPWERDAIKEAVETNTIHYYFMCGNGMIMSKTESNPYKWGDACLVVFPDGKTMLVDSGMKAYGPILVENLRRLNIKRLDYVVFSHQHNDHTHGALREGGVFDNIEIGQVYWNGIINAAWKNFSMENECSKRGIPLQIIKRGDVLDFGVVKAEILWPEEGMAGMTIEETQDLNNLSVVMRLDYKDHSSLFTGDLYEKGEQWLVQKENDRLNVDLMKVCHHGHSTSSSYAFVSKASPQLAVATGFALVKPDVWEVFENTGATLLDDQFYGYIHAVSDGTNLDYDTSVSREEKK